jgi:hypothetical protein
MHHVNAALLIFCYNGSMVSMTNHSLKVLHATFKRLNLGTVALPCLVL